MIIVDKLIQLAQDDKNEFAHVISNIGDFNIVNEKLHSMAQWLNQFTEAYQSYDLDKLKTLELNSRTIELINFLSVCNGILDAADGLFQVAKKYFNIVPERHKKVDFKRTRKINIEHDNNFEMLEYSDVEYFKHIRAVFGQHPSNLKYSNKVRGFSSWTFDNTNGIFEYDSDLYTSIYFDQEENGWGIKFHIYYEEIIGFVETQISYIEKLEDFIVNEINIKRINNCTKIDNWDESLQIKEKLCILKDEISKRYYYKDYHYLLSAVEMLEDMANTDTKLGFEYEYNHFISKINLSINEIFRNVSTCEQNELNFFNFFVDEVKNAIGYPYYREKVSLYLIGFMQYRDIYEMVMKKICNKLNMYISYKNYDFYFYLFIIAMQGETVFTNKRIQ